MKTPKAPRALAYAAPLQISSSSLSAGGELAVVKFRKCELNAPTSAASFLGCIPRPASSSVFRRSPVSLLGASLPRAIQFCRPSNSDRSLPLSAYSSVSRIEENKSADYAKVEGSAGSKSGRRGGAALPSVREISSASPGALVFFARQIVSRKSLSKDLWRAVCLKVISLHRRLRPKDAAAFLSLALLAQKFFSDVPERQLSESGLRQLLERHSEAVTQAADALAVGLLRTIQKHKFSELHFEGTSSEGETANLSPFFLASAASSVKKLTAVLPVNSQVQEALMAAAMSSSFTNFSGFDLATFVSAAAHFRSSVNGEFWSSLAPFLIAELSAFSSFSAESLKASCERVASLGLLRDEENHASKVDFAKLALLLKASPDRRRVNSAVLLSALCEAEGFVQRRTEVFVKLLSAIRIQILHCAVRIFLQTAGHGVRALSVGEEESPPRLIFEAEFSDLRDLALISKTLSFAEELQEAERQSCAAVALALSPQTLELAGAAFDAVSRSLVKESLGLKFDEQVIASPREHLSLSLARQAALVLRAAHLEGASFGKVSLVAVSAVMREAFRAVQNLFGKDEDLQLARGATASLEVLTFLAFSSFREETEAFDPTLASSLSASLSSLLISVRRLRDPQVSKAALLVTARMLDAHDAAFSSFLSQASTSHLAVYVRAVAAANAFANDLQWGRKTEEEEEGISKKEEETLLLSVRRSVESLAEQIATRCEEVLCVGAKEEGTEPLLSARLTAAVACSFSTFKNNAAAARVVRLCGEELSRLPEIGSEATLLSNSQCASLLNALAEVRMRDERLLTFLCQRLAEDLTSKLSKIATGEDAVSSLWIVLSKAVLAMSRLDFAPVQILTSSSPFNHQAFVASEALTSHARRLATVEKNLIFQSAKDPARGSLRMDFQSMARLFMTSALTDFRVFSPFFLSSEKEETRVQAEMRVLGLSLASNCLIDELRQWRLAVERTDSDDTLGSAVSFFARRLEQICVC